MIEGVVEIFELLTATALLSSLPALPLIDGFFVVKLVDGCVL